MALKERNRKKHIFYSIFLGVPMNTPIIKVENLSKKYIISHEYQNKNSQYVALRDVIAEKASALGRKIVSPFNKNFNPQAQTKCKENFWALRDVSFEINQGERIGIIGGNGAGKTTLLKLLSRITAPTTGRIHLRGRVASLLEVGTGFHPELTGRENIYLNGAILGMTKFEIKNKFNEIVEFAEVEKFLDTPVKRYSSGMYVRLAFAVAAHLEPEILMVDEVLAVGDYKFQEKCLGKMQEVSTQGRTVLFVSHNMKAISELCTKTILLKNGNIVSVGDTNSIISQYAHSDQGDSAETTWLEDNAPGNNTVRLLCIKVVDEKDEVKSEFSYIEMIKIVVVFKVLDNTLDLYLNMYIENENGDFVLVTTSVNSNPRFEKGIFEAQFIIRPHFLNEGRYFVGQFLFKERTVTSPENIAHVKYPVSFTVSYSGKFTGGQLGKHPGIVRPDWDWEIVKKM
jgi:lipopolysaccharide transport system ATP-binding protein